MTNFVILISIETSVLKHKIGPDMFEKIDHGDVHELSIEVLESFLSSCPKETEVQLLQTAI